MRYKYISSIFGLFLFGSVVNAFYVDEEQKNFGRIPVQIHTHQIGTLPHYYVPFSEPQPQRWTRPDPRPPRGYGRGGNSNGVFRRKETPEEYQARTSRNAAQKNSKTIEYARTLGINDASLMSPGKLQSEIARRKHEIAEEREQNTRDYAESLGIDGASWMSIDALRREIAEKKDARRRAAQDRKSSRVSSDPDDRSLGRMVGDGRGGSFFAVWGKDDN